MFHRSPPIHSDFIYTNNIDKVETLTNHFIVGMVVALFSGIAIGSAYNVFENSKNNQKKNDKS